MQLNTALFVIKVCYAICLSDTECDISTALTFGPDRQGLQLLQMISYKVNITRV